MTQPGEHTSEDTQHMRRALALAEQTIALASPNPRVGCVLVKDGVIVGEGAHIYDRFDHAEIVALKQAGEAARGATAYVTLEPCSHHGRTGPCADALIAAGIARVVAATLDPNPRVSGSGVARLRAAGIQVDLGLCAAEARALNDGFAQRIRTGSPFVTLKSALSAEGCIAPPQQEPGWPVWISGDAARTEVQRMRHASDAILTGIGTALADDPALTDRTGLPRRRKLLRVVLDTELRLPAASHLVRSAEGDLLIFCSKQAPEPRKHALEAAGAAVHRINAVDGHLDLKAVLADLGHREILSVLVEAGSRVNEAFLQEDLVGRVVLFRSQKLLGEGAIPFAGEITPEQIESRWKKGSHQTFDEDLCLAGYLHDPWAERPL